MGCSSHEILETKQKKIQPNKELEENFDKTKPNLNKKIKESKINKEEKKFKELNNKEEKHEKEEKDENKKEEKDPKNGNNQGNQKKEKFKKLEKNKLCKEEKKEIEEQENDLNVEYDSNKKKIKGILSGVKSRYILEYIFEPISKKKKLYLVNYSKSFQKYFNITIKDYQEEYLNNIIPSNAFNEFLNKVCIPYGYYNTDKTKRKELYQKFFSNCKCDQKIIGEYIIKKCEKKYKEFKGEGLGCIDINNPFYNLISKSKLMNGFDLYIMDEIIKNKYLFNDLNHFFMKLEDYPKILFMLSLNYLGLVKLLNINFKKLKKSSLIIPENQNNNEYLNKFFSFFDDMTNLEFLELFLSNPINSESLEVINGFINLKSLHINSININSVFNLKLPNLKKLNITGCKNVAFSENQIYNIQELYIYNSKIIRPNSLLIFPELKYFFTDSVEISSFLDLTSAKKLESISQNMSDLLKIEIPFIKFLALKEKGIITLK